MTYLIDSDWLIDALNGVSEAVKLLRDRKNDGLVVSIINLGEIYDGALGSPEPERHLADARHFLAPYPILPLTEPIMMQFGRLRSDLRRHGQLIPDFDLLIASTALVHDLTLVTRNMRHFQRIPNLNIYTTDHA